MKLKKIKTEAEVLDAIRTNVAGRSEIEITSVDGSVKGVRIGSAHFTIDSYSFAMHAETDREEASRYRVLAKVEGFPDAVSYHEDYSEAESAKAAYPPFANVTSESVKVWINAAGEVVGEKGSGGKPVDHNGDDIPF